jgi:hypothetical protein
MSRLTLLRRLAAPALAAALGAGVAVGLDAPAQAHPGHSSGAGGPVVLDGMDPVCHAPYEDTDGYIRVVLASLHHNASRAGNDGSIAVLGSGPGSNACGPNLSDQMAEFLGDISPTPAVSYHQSGGDVNDFFTDLAAGTVNPAVIWIPDNWDGQPDAELTANATGLADFVNTGGGLFSNMGGYGWLTALLPDAVYTDDGCNGGPAVTADGVASFPDLTDQLVQSCWHGFFSGDTGSLVPIADWTNPGGGSDRVAVAIGGASVTLPNGVELEASAATAEAGTGVTLTATVSNNSGPLSGLAVTFTVDSGPDAGPAGSDTTDADGEASVTLTGAAAGVDQITASVTIGGVVKTASTTVTWTAPSATAPAAPGLSATGTLDTLSVTVTPPGNDGGSALVKHVVTVAGRGPVRTVEVAAGGGTVVVRNLWPGVKYTVKARAVNGVGPSPVRVVKAWTSRVPTDPIPMRTLKGKPMYPGMTAVLTDNGVFRYLSPKITKSGRKQIAGLVEGLAGASVIRCAGHTGGTPSKANLKLGLRRAKAACKALAQAGLDAEFQVVSYGARRPVVKKGSNKKLAKNRRVEITVIR